LINSSSVILKKVELLSLKNCRLDWCFSGLVFLIHGSNHVKTISILLEIYSHLNFRTRWKKHSFLLILSDFIFFHYSIQTSLQIPQLILKNYKVKSYMIVIMHGCGLISSKIANDHDTMCFFCLSFCIYTHINYMIQSYFIYIYI